MWLFRALVVIFVVYSNKIRKIVLTNSIEFVVQKILEWQFFKNNWKLIKGQWCGNEILENSKSLKKVLKMDSIK